MDALFSAISQAKILHKPGFRESYSLKSEPDGTGSGSIKPNQRKQPHAQ